jgi:NAD+ synthase
MKFSKNVLDIDGKSEIELIIQMLRQKVQQGMRKHGGVIGISGGIDSSVVLGLCIKAFGAENVTAVMIPERDSDPISEELARNLAARFGIKPIMEDITPVLDGFNCYKRRDEAIRRIFPEYNAAIGYKSKIVLPNNLLDGDTLNFYSLTIYSPDGEEKTKRLPAREYMQIVAASNFKQRTRMAMLYFHAELRNFAVIGTANKNEHDQGFFVKYGDGGVDIQPVGHLYKTQVYQLAKFLNVPEEIQKRIPTTDTYSAHSTQQEFFFRLPFETMDILWFAQEHNIPINEVAEVMELDEIQIQRAYNDFIRKKRTTEYLRFPPVFFNSQ